MSSPRSRAKTRAELPPAVAVVQADAIVVGVVVQSNALNRVQSRVTLRIERVLRGEISPSEITYLSRGDLPAVGARWVQHLSRVGGDWVGLRDGSTAHTDAIERERVAQIARAGKWSAPVKGWSAALALAPSSASVGDIVDAYVVYKNVSDSPQTFAYKEWPQEAHTYWVLTVARDGEVIEALAHPHVTSTEVVDYFSQHGNSFEVELQPGESFPVGLLRINSAEAGWGYKQRLLYKYWPMELPGKYTVTAVDVGFEGRDPLKIPPVELVLK